MIFFDLPTETKKNRHDYAVFRKYLVKSGFIMMQQSVYSKLIMNGVAGEAIKKRIRENLPPEGLVEMLEITETQFGRIEYLLGERQSEILESPDRLVEV